MKKRLLSVLLLLALCLGLLPTAALAAEREALPDWYFLFAVFKNVNADGKDKDGKTVHVTYSMSPEEVDIARNNAQAFEAYMNSLGVMRAHVEVVEIEEPVTELKEHSASKGSLVGPVQAAPLLKNKVDLDRYDHICCIVGLDNLVTRWIGVSSSTFENGTGHSCVNFVNREYALKNYAPLENYWRPALYVHEFLHFGEHLNQKWGEEFVLHRDGKTHYVKSKTDDWKDYYTDAILNQLTDLDVFPEGGTGIRPIVWQVPPHALRTLTEWTVPSGVTTIGHDAFLNCTNLTQVTIPSGVTCIDVSAFHGCTGLTRVTIPSTVTTIEGWAFAECAALKEIFIPASVTSLGGVAFQRCTGLTNVSLPSTITRIEDYTFSNCSNLKDIYYSGSEAQWKAIPIGTSNSALSRAAIHYNSLLADVKTDDWFAGPVTWALGNSITNGTGNGSFSPNSNCTQGQILTFLWRAKGSPEPVGAVKGDEYYAAALQWATEQGLTEGAFSPDAPCTRSDTVVYLWKLAGSPAAAGSRFADVPAGTNYAQAVSWAVDQRITTGTDEHTFSPDQTCTRGQIVTFLHRALAK